MILSKLLLPVFALLFQQVFCSFTLICEVDKQIVKETFEKDTEAFENKIDGILKCGEGYDKKSQSEKLFKVCIRNLKLPKSYETSLLQLKSADFDNDKSLADAFTKIGVAVCKKINSDNQNLKSDIPKDKLSVEVEFDLEDEEDDDANMKKKKKAGGEEDDEDEVQFNGYFGRNEKESDSEDDSDDENTADSANSVSTTSSESSTSMSYPVIIGLSLGAIMLIVLIIYFFAGGKKKKDTQLPPATPMQPVAPFQQPKPAIPVPSQPNAYPPPRPAQRHPPVQQHPQPFHQPPQPQFDRPEPPVQFNHPPQQARPASPFIPPNYPNGSQASLASGASNDLPPPSYHDINRPSQNSNPYAKR